VSLIVGLIMLDQRLRLVRRSALSE
jgi:hypothetical protein